MLKAKGKLLVTADSVKVVLDNDFIKYYKWLFDRAHWHTIPTQYPKYGAHIGILNPNIHKNVDTAVLMPLNGKDIWFQYNVSGNFGGFTKGFLNFWLDVSSPELEDMARTLGVLKLHKDFSYFHITILNTKNK